MSFGGYLTRYFWMPPKIVSTTEESPGESPSIKKFRWRLFIIQANYTSFLY